MRWNSQVVFRATFVSRRGAIIDLYLETLKHGHEVSTPSFLLQMGQPLFLDRACEYKNMRLDLFAQLERSAISARDRASVWDGSGQASSADAPTALS